MSKLFSTDRRALDLAHLTLCQRIGSLCMLFAQLELFLGGYCAQIISDDQNIGAIVTAEVSFKNLVAMYKSLLYYKCKDEKVLREVDQLVDKFIKCEETRNRLLHSQLSIDGSEPMSGNVFRFKTTAKIKKGLESKVIKDSQSSIDKDLLFLDATYKELIDFQSKLREKTLAQFPKVGLPVIKENW